MGLRDAYRTSILALFPRGRAWLQELGSFIYELADGLSEECVRIHERAMTLVEEADPRKTNELLPDWERFLGLPDDCESGSQTVAQRRAQVVSKYTLRGGQSIEYFEKLARQLGFEVAISNYRPFEAGRSRAGDPLTNGWEHYFLVRAPLNSITYFRAGQSAAGDPLAVWGNDLLECRIRRAKPAQSGVNFSYE